MREQHRQHDLPDLTGSSHCPGQQCPGGGFLEELDLLLGLEGEAEEPEWCVGRVLEAGMPTGCLGNKV